MTDIDELVKRLRENPLQPCEWHEQDPDYGNIWETACDAVFEINDGCPSDNDMKFCAYCGRVLEEHRYQSPALEEDEE